MPIILVSRNIGYMQIFTGVPRGGASDDRVVYFIICRRRFSCIKAQNSLHTFLRNFPIDGEAAKVLLTSWQQVVVMEFRKRHDTTDTTDFCPRQLVIETCRLCCGLCCGLVTGKSPTCYTDLLRGNWCNGFWP